MPTYYDRVRVSTRTTGDGSLTLGPNIPGYQGFDDAAIPDGTQVRYLIESGVDVEIGLGTVTDSGGTLSRDTVSFSTNSGSKINVGLNAAIAITWSAEEANAVLSGLATVTAAVITATTAADAAEAAQAAAEAAAASVPSVDTDGTLSANSDLVVPSQKAVKTYADQLIATADAMVFKGVIDASANPNYPAADRGHTYKISVAGKIGGASGTTVDAGDMIIATVDGSAAGDQATVGANWAVVQTNLVAAYVAGGTDVAIADGGSGASTAAGAATNFGLGTGDSPQFAGVNVGHATDTTIGRTSAGVINVEGVQHNPHIPINSKSAAYTTVLADANQAIYHPSTDNNARTFTIDSNANVAYPVGTVLVFINEINTVTIAITADTLTLAGAGSTGSRSLAANGVATAVKVASTKWVISGTGLT